MSDEPDALATVTRAVARARGPEREPARLRAVHPPDLSWSIAIGSAPVVVGRTASEEGVRPLAHETVSRRHLELLWDATRGGHAGRDLGSHNGTRIDGTDL